MGYETLIRGLIKNVASKQFESMKLDITHEAWIGQDGMGRDEYAAPVTRRALVDLTKRIRYSPSGAQIQTVATLTWLDVIPHTTANAGQQRVNPIDPRDVLTLPDGTTAPVQETGGFADSGTGEPFASTTVLGVVSGTSNG